MAEGVLPRSRRQGRSQTEPLRRLDVGEQGHALPPTAGRQVISGLPVLTRPRAVFRITLRRAK